MNYIIVQAGGKGTRLGYLTKNKPKALAPVENLPMLFHLFRKYPRAHFVIIADYKDEVLREYLRAFADVKYIVVKASGSGTCGGVRQSLDLVPENQPFMLIWSDLILPEGFELPEEYEIQSFAEARGIAVGSSSDNKRGDDGCRGAILEANVDDNHKGEGGHESYEPEKPGERVHDYIGLSTTFPCRWKYKNGEFAEERSTEFGVAGFFLFHDKSVLETVPESGELVRWMQGKGLTFNTLSLAGTREFGLLEEYEKLETVKTRPFNRITIDGDVLTKEPVDEQGKTLAIRESAWYERAREFHIAGIPKIYSTNPLKMEYIKGRNIYECEPGALDKDQKLRILSSLITTLKELHNSSSIPADAFSLKEAYFNKTMQRLSKIEYLVPFAREEYIVVNGRRCRNVFWYKEQLERKLDQLKADRFPFIHGDCTFSNLMVREDGSPVLIDPRGYFGFTELYGDERYDWAKLYYSIVGNYDRFNLKKFSLDIGGGSIYTEYTKDDDKGLKAGEVRLSIESNGWEDMEAEFFKLTGADEYEIKLLHAVIWLSLTTYAWQDYDSICGAFYNGLYYLEEVL